MLLQPSILRASLRASTSLTRILPAGLAAAMALGAPQAARAVVLNDDAANAAGGIANYYDRANAYDNVVALVNDGGAFCTGSLINSRTILTAAHCVESGPGAIYISARNGISFSPVATQADPNNRAMSGVAAHRHYQPTILQNDIALISLDSPVTAVRPVTLVGAQASAPRVGTVIRMVGYGASGTGANPPERSTGPYDDKRRMAETLYAGYFPGRVAGFGGNDQSYIMGQFEDPQHPDDPVGPIPRLQAGAAPGDSGGPLFLETRSGMIQIGVADWVVNAGGLPQFGYGSITGWTPVADYLDWIALNNPLRQVTAQAGDYLWSDPAAWRDLYDGAAVVPDNRDGDFAGHGRIGRYYQVALKEAGSVTLDMDPTVDSVWVGGVESALAIPSGRTLTSIVGTDISAGRLAVDGTLSTGFLDLSGGLVTGSGRIVADGGFINRGGIVAPGTEAAIGTLTVQGDYRQTEAGILAIRFMDGAADRLAVTGTARLGGALQVSGHLEPGRTEASRIVAARAVEGRFGTVSEPYAFFDVSLDYAARDVTMTVARNDTRFADVGVTESERNVGAAAEALPTADPVRDAVLQLDEASARAAFDSLSGEIHGSMRSALLDTSRYVRDAVTGRLRQSFGAQGALAPQVQSLPGTNWGLWGQGFGSWGQMKGGDAASLDSSTGGFFLGTDALVGGAWRLGLAGGYSQTTADADRRLSSSAADNYHIAAYAGTQWGPLGLRLGSAVTWHSIDTSRQIAFTGFSDAVRSSEDGRTAQLFGDAGYSFALGTTTLEPFAGLAYVNLHTDGFAEEGRTAALRGWSGSENALFSTLGLRASSRFALSAGSAVTLRGALAWRHAFGDVEPEAFVAFRSGALPFGVTGTPIARDALVAEAGLDFEVGGNVTLGVSYAGQLADKAQDQTVKGQLTWQF